MIYIYIYERYMSFSHLAVSVYGTLVIVFKLKKKIEKFVVPTDHIKKKKTRDKSLQQN